MTDKPTPKEIDDLVYELRQAGKDDTYSLVCAVLAKWGQPPAGAGEVAEHYRNAIASACEGWTMPDGLRKHLETALWSPPTPQPTQSQAGVCEWTYVDDPGRDYWDSACGEAWMFTDGGPADNNVRFCQGCGKPVHITPKEGGQHGTE